MKKKLLFEEDTAFVRDNLLFNYCLWDDNALLIESYFNNNQISLNFDMNNFRFIISGLDKKYNILSDNTSFHSSLKSYYHLRDSISKVLDKYECKYNIFLIKVENSKQVGIIFSSSKKDKDLVTMCEEIDSLSKDVPYYSLKFKKYVRTSLSNVYSGYEGIHPAYMEARRLNDLSFFNIKEKVITTKLIDTLTIPCSLISIEENNRILRNCLSYDGLGEINKQLNYLFNILINNSFNYTFFLSGYYDLISYFNLIKQVYNIELHTMNKKVEDLFSINESVEYLKKVIKEIYTTLQFTNRYKPEILLSISYIKNNYSADFSLKTLADFVGSNPTYLSSEFNRSVGKSLSEYVTDIRLTHSLEDLANTDLSIKEICTNCGFSSVKYFNELFKKHYKVTPTSYRQKMKQ